MSEFWSGFWVGVSFIAASSVIIGMLIAQAFSFDDESDEHEDVDDVRP